MGVFTATDGGDCVRFTVQSRAYLLYREHETEGFLPILTESVLATPLCMMVMCPQNFQ
jgi:hypothetical protein